MASGPEACVSVGFGAFAYAGFAALQEVPRRKAGAMIDFQVGLHVFMIVLIFGTLWRVLQYHAMASPNVHLQHVGMAMSTQY